MYGVLVRIPKVYNSTCYMLPRKAECNQSNYHYLKNKKKQKIADYYRNFSSAVCTRVWVHFLFPFQHFQQELPWDISYYIETPESIHNKGRIWLLKAPHVPAYVHNAHTLHLQVIYSSFMWYIRNYARCACNRLLFANHKLWFTRWSKQFSI